jgi:FAD/FMN-containing dehydrogenase
VTAVELMHAIHAAGGRLYLRGGGASLAPGRCPKSLVDAAMLRGVEIEALLYEHSAPCASDAVASAERILKVRKC